MTSECEETQAKIYSMFTFNFTPENVDRVRKELNPHLLKCAECRAYLKEMQERKTRGKK